MRLALIMLSDDEMDKVEANLQGQINVYNPHLPFWAPLLTVTSALLLIATSVLGSM